MTGGRECFFQLRIYAKAGGRICPLAEERSRKLKATLIKVTCRHMPDLCWERIVAYATIESEEAIRLEDVDEGSKHAFRSIWGARLQADL